MTFSLFPRIRELRLPAPRAVLQVGASYGQEMQDFLNNGIASGVFIEPLPTPFAHLSGLCQRIPNYVAVQALCADEIGRVHRFHVASNGGMSSSILAPGTHLEVNPDVHFTDTVDMPSATVDQVMAVLRQQGQAAVVDPIDLLVMDCQGAEYRILQGAGGLMRQLKYIYMEVMRNELYSGQVPFLTYCMHLEALGFTLNDVYFGYPEQAGNALFIRKDLVSVSAAH
jgi:FkbM family methyltransferase